MQLEIYEKLNSIGKLHKLVHSHHAMTIIIMERDGLLKMKVLLRSQLSVQAMLKSAKMTLDKW